MNREKKISSIIYTIIFVLFIIVIGFKSLKNLINFYVNHEIDYNEWSVELGSKFETDIATTFFEKIQFINLNGAIRNLLGQQEMNGVIKLNNGYLFTPIAYSSDEYLQHCTNNIKNLDNYLHQRGTKLVYVSTPYTSGKYDPELPEGIDDYGNDNIDRFMGMLKTAEIDSIDIREAMHDDEIDHYSMMYKTDHHWTTEAGFYTYKILENYIKNISGCNVDERISNINNYTITTYKNWHLGSRGQRTGRYFAGIDDFDLITPNFKTIIKNDEGTIGTMPELALDMKPLSNKQYTSRYTYDRVLIGALKHYTNLDCKNNIKILFVTDSFGDAVAPYLMMGFKEIAYISNMDDSGDFIDYIESYNPDFVILMCYPTILRESNNIPFDFLTS